MKAFAYVTARSPESAVLLAREGGHFLAGGMDLLGELKEHLAEPALLVNIKALPDTREITPGAAHWTIGANVTLAALAHHAELHRVFPVIAEAAAAAGSPQMRNIATLGGNLAQHSRCWYYRHRDVQCLKKGGTACYARGGESKFHALFTGCACLSPIVSNIAIALTALDATAVIRRDDREVRLPMPRVYESAWRNPRVHHTLRADDLILRVEIPVAAGQRSAYLQIAEKGSFDWALVSCAVAARFEGARPAGARIVLGGVAPIPWQVDEAGSMLDGGAFTNERVAAALDRLLRDARPQEQNAYKLPIARALVRRALQQIASMG